MGGVGLGGLRLTFLVCCGSSRVGSGPLEVSHVQLRNFRLEVALDGTGSWSRVDINLCRGDRSGLRTVALCC